MAEIKSANYSADFRKIVSVVARRPDGKVLLLRRADTRREYPGEWDFVSGYIDDLETVAQSALRELTEETNLTGKIIEISAEFEVNQDDTNWLNNAVLVLVENLTDLRIDQAESQNYQWIDIKEVGNYSAWAARTAKHLQTRF